MPRASSRFLVVALATLLATGWLSARPLPSRAAGSVSLAALDSAYAQDFNTLGALGTTNPSSGLPAGWEMSESGTGANAFYAAGTGSSATGDTYSFGTFGAFGDRAFGSLRSTVVPTLGASFTNDTGTTVTGLDVSYAGEMYRAGVASRNAADRLDFQLSTDATSLTTGTWSDYDALDFASPAISTTLGPKDGNASAFRSALTLSITGLSIANGASFWIRWTDYDISGLDDGLAVDDFSLTPRGVDPDAPPTFTIAGLGCSTDGAGGSFLVSVADEETAPGDLSLALTGNTNATLVPDAGVAISGAADRTVSVLAADHQNGTGILTFTLGDGVNDVTFDIGVQVGTDADESLSGTEGSDLLVGAQGADVLSGLGGGDVLCGGNGPDSLSGGDGSDLLDGDRGNDVLVGDDGNDGLRGGQGIDSLTGATGADAFSGNAGADVNADFNAGEGDTSDGT